eukprot:6622202-Pyramimonas_sp.AAC.1
MASQVVVGCSRPGFAACGRRPARGWRRRDVAPHVPMHYVFEEAPNWSRWVDFRSEVAQGCRTQVSGLRVDRGATATVLAMLRCYTHSSAQAHCTLMFHHVSSPPGSAVKGEEQS